MLFLGANAMNEALLQRFRARMAARPAIAAGPDAPASGIAAAVLLPVVAHLDGATVLLTVRSSTLADHAGQISLPGGRIDPSDADAVSAALREANEEVGLAASAIEVLGCLAEQRTGTGFCVTPVVGVVRPPLSLRLAVAEVDDAFEVPLAFILDSANHRRETAVLGGAARTYDVLQYHDHRIWGATAAILVTFAQLMSAGSLVGASS